MIRPATGVVTVEVAKEGTSTYFMSRKDFNRLKIRDRTEFRML